MAKSVSDQLRTGIFRDSRTGQFLEKPGRPPRVRVEGTWGHTLTIVGTDGGKTRGVEAIEGSPLPPRGKTR
jgi:hypothetical protein